MIPMRTALWQMLCGIPSASVGARAVLFFKNILSYQVKQDPLLHSPRIGNFLLRQKAVYFQIDEVWA
jgi:hypothetical protein